MDVIKHWDSTRNVYAEKNSSISFPSSRPALPFSRESHSFITLCLSRGGLSISYVSLSSKDGGEGSGTPLQYSCLENPMGGGAWKVADHGVAQSQTRLSDLAAAAEVVCARADVNADYLLSNLPLGGRAGVDIWVTGPFWKPFCTLSENWKPSPAIPALAFSFKNRNTSLSR